MRKRLQDILGDFKELRDDHRASAEFRKLTKRAVSNPSDLTTDQVRELRAEVVGAMENLLSRTEKDQRDFTEAEEASYKFAERYLDVVNAQLDYRTENQITGKMLEHTKGWPTPISGPGTFGGGTEIESRSYRGMFHRDGQYLSDGGFTGRNTIEKMREFFLVQSSGNYDPRTAPLLTEARTMLEGTGFAGGFAVPPEMAALLLDSALEDELVRPRAAIFPMKSAELKIPAFDSKDHTNLFGGLSLQWLAEVSPPIKNGPTSPIQTDPP